MKRLLFWAVALAFIFASTANASNKNVSLLETTTVTSGTPVTVTFSSKCCTAAYLVITTTAEVDTTTLNIEINILINGISIELFDNAADISTETTTVYLLGSTVSQAAPPLEVTTFPLGRTMNIVITAATGTSFDVQADIILLDGSW